MYTIGFDPEFFFQDANGKFISAVGLVGGSKDEPKDIGNGCKVQEDNVAVEFNTPPVNLFDADAAEQVWNHFQYVYNWIEENVCKKHGLVISKVASAIFDQDQLQTEAAQTFGCEPDYNSYTGEENPKPKGPEGLRTCGGHIHIGYDMPNKETSQCIAQDMDSVLGLFSVLEDQDSRRRLLYGKAGALRYKDYGVEYRTLSNYWIFSKEDVQKIVGRCQESVSTFAHINDEDFDEAVQYAINHNDASLAKFLLKE